MREYDGTPRAIRMRHELLVANYFDPDMQNTTELRLLLELDPVRVARSTELSTGRIFLTLMTESDVVALAHLIPFSTSNDEPRSRKLPRQRIDSLAAEVDRFYSKWPYDNVALERLFQEAAELWAGIQREWPNLNAEQKSMVREYAGRSYMALMTKYLYGKILDLNQYEASSRQNSDASTALMKLQSDSDIVKWMHEKLARDRER